MPEQLTLADAAAIIAAGMAAAQTQDCAATLAVVDQGGHLLALQRADGAPFGTVRFAERKAQTSAALGAPTSGLAGAVAAVPGLMSAAFDGIAFVGGGVPLRRDGALIGGVGVAGGLGDQDERIAQAAAQGLK